MSTPLKTNTDQFIVLAVTVELAGQKEKKIPMAL